MGSELKGSSPCVLALRSSLCLRSSRHNYCLGNTHLSFLSGKQTKTLTPVFFQYRAVYPCNIHLEVPRLCSVL